jgi:hypothetical protein
MFVNGPHSIKEFGPLFSSKELHMTNGSLMRVAIQTKNEFPVSKVLSGTTHPYADLSTAFDDIATHPDDIPVKPDKREDKIKKEKIRTSVKNLEALK